MKALKYEEKPKQQQDKDETVQFDFEEVIDDASKTPQSGHIEDEDIGGEVVTAATTIAGASAVSCFHAKRSLLVGIAVAVLVERQGRSSYILTGSTRLPPGGRRERGHVRLQH